MKTFAIIAAAVLLAGSVQAKSLSLNEAEKIERREWRSYLADGRLTKLEYDYLISAQKIVHKNLILRWRLYHFCRQASAGAIDVDDLPDLANDLLALAASDRIQRASNLSKDGTKINGINTSD